MNVNDTEVIWSILKSRGYEMTTNPSEANLWLLITCSIREGAESKIWRKLHHIKHNKKARMYR
jgi:tRNA A37 methylthiotransferase MiaB